LPDAYRGLQPHPEVTRLTDGPAQSDIGSSQGVSDWSSVAIAGIGAGAGVLGGGVGYLGARLQARVGFRQIDAESDRLRQAHEEDHFRNRQATYHNFLDVEQRFLALVSTGMPDVSEDVYSQWLADYHHTYDGVVLLGAESVRDAAQAVNDSHYVISADQLGEGDFTTRLRKSYLKHQPEYRANRAALLDAMRADVAPESRH
jgi:hypothetical protein